MRQYSDLVLKYGVGVLWFQCGRTVTCFEVWCGCVVVSVRQDSDFVLKYGVGVLWFQCGRTVTCFEVWCGCVVVSVRQADRPLSGGAGPVLCGLCQVGLLAGRQVSVCSEQSNTGMQNGGWGGGGGKRHGETGCWF